ncbi:MULTISPECIES: hypothetical protein [unclassified Streptomyces]|uniref:hypothetical protein n=1 Tax=Streptomyces sp. NBRC 14336 TaxID=3030992 RepID=UPI0033279C19
MGAVVVLGAAEVVRPTGAELAPVPPVLAPPPPDGTDLAPPLVRPVDPAEVPPPEAEFDAAGAPGAAVTSGTSVTVPVGPAVRAVAPGAPTAV